MAAVPAAFADAIRLRLHTELDIQPPHAVARIEVSNLGTEAAYSIRTDVLLEETGDVSALESIPRLRSGETADRECRLVLPSQPGQHVLLVRARYTDRRGFPYSAVQAVPLTVEADEAPPAWLQGEMQLVLLDKGAAVVKLRLTSVDEEDRDVRIRLWMPHEIEAPPERHVVVPAYGHASVEMSIPRSRVRPGSIYPIYALAHYVADGYRHTLPIPGVAQRRPVAPLSALRDPWTLWAVAAAAVFFLVAQALGRFRPAFVRQQSASARLRAAWFDALFLIALTVFIAAHLAPGAWVLDTVTAGGDTPAHRYLVTRLRDQLRQHGPIISWASGWWCGFPMFQFYFPLPYLLMAMMSFLLPLNVAFKLVSVSGLLALPAASYAAGRRMGLPRPAPLLMAVAALPLLFARTHTMWGVNIHSTLAGMIANSVSFPLMLLTVAAGFRDARDHRFRLGTVLLMAALIGSHFFTAVMGAATLALVPFLPGQPDRRAALRVLLREAGLAVLLMAWWLVPLVAKSDYSMEFGVNWPVTLRQGFPGYTRWLLPFALAAPILAWHRRQPAVWLWVWMGVASSLLFYFGNALSPVFVNVRLWPFVFHAFLVLAAAGMGLLLAFRRAAAWAVLALTLATLRTLSQIENQPGDWAAAAAAPCAAWNYEGLERKPYWSVIRDLVLPLDGTPGRLANDLSDENTALGSSRVFECVPSLIRKPVLEGGLVNSALGALFAYYVQGEMSSSSAGLPTILRPARFDPETGTRRLELLNVKHFIARDANTKDVLRRHPDWQMLCEAEGWALFELRSNDGRYVVVPPRPPLFVETSRWKEHTLEWLYTPAWLDQPVVFVPPGAKAPPNAPPAVSASAFRPALAQAKTPSGEICDWLRLGPFSRMPPPLAEPAADPCEGDRALGRRWTAFFSPAPQVVNVFAPDRRYAAVYYFANIFAPAEADAVLLCGAAARQADVWWNGRAAPATASTEDEDAAWARIPIRLQAGRNRLLIRLRNIRGDARFQVRLLDPSGHPFEELISTSANAPPPTVRLLPPIPLSEREAVYSETMSEDRIRFSTSAIGQPHLIKCSHYPNWRVRGAEAVYRVTPGFMLVYPTQRDVELCYGALWSDRLGRWLTAGGWLAVLIALLKRPASRRLLGPFGHRVTWLKLLDGTMGMMLCWLISLLRHAFGRAEAPVVAPMPPRRALIIRPGGMGDMILLLPVLRHLQAVFPSMTFDIVCERRNRAVLALAGWARRALAYDAHPLRLLWTLRRRRYDLAIDAEQYHYFSAVIAWWSGAPIRIGFKINPARNHLYTHLVNYSLDGPETEQFMRLLTPFVAPAGPAVLEGTLSAPYDALAPADEKRLERLMLARGLPVAVDPGSNAPFKRWPVERFRELIERLLAAGFGVVLVGQPDRATKRVLETLPRSAGGALEMFDGCFSLAQTAAILARARLFVGNDSGLAHLAAALGTPTVVIFGPTDERKWGLSDERHAVVRRAIGCAPCCIFGYRKFCRHSACIRDLPLEAVLAACERFLGRPLRP